MFYFSEHNSWIKIWEKPKMTPEEAKEFLAEKREYYKMYPNDYPIPLSKNKDYQWWRKWAKQNTQL